MRSFLYAAGLAQLGRLASALPLSAYASASAATCNGTFNAITAQQFVDRMNPGWNLGNTLDAIEDEGDWNNAPVTEVTFDDVKKAGFKGIRLPGKYSICRLNCSYSNSIFSHLGIPLYLRGTRLHR